MSKKVTKSFKFKVEFYEDGSSSNTFTISDDSIPKTVEDLVPILTGLELGRKRIVRLIESKSSMQDPISLEDLKL